MKTSKLFITSLLAAAAMSAVPAFGATFNGITWTESADGTVRTFTGTALGYVLINGTDANQGLNGAGSVTKVIFNSVGGTGDAAWFKNVSMSQDIELQGTGLVIKGGTTSSGAAVFTGVITGAEASSFTWNNDNAGNQQTYRFEGNLTGFSGSFNRTTATSGNIQFGSATATSYSSSATVTDGVISNISGTGSITTSAGIVYNYTGGANGETLSVNNSSITAKTLTFGGGATYVVASALTGQNSRVSNNTLTISAGTTTFTGSIANFGTITVAGGATADFSNTTFKFGTLTADSVTTTISNSGTVTFGEGTIFDVDSAASLVRGAQLLGGMSGQTQTFSIANLSVGGYLVNQRGSAAFSVSESGVLTLDSYTASNTNYSLTWNGGDSDVWKVGGTGWTTTDTTGEVTFQNGDSVTFGTGTTNAATLEGSLKVGRLTISDATTLSVADGSTASVTTGTLSLGANLTISDGVTLKLTSVPNVNTRYDGSKILGSGTFAFSASTSGNGSGVDLSNFNGEAYLTGGLLRLGDATYYSSFGANASLRVASGAALVFNGEASEGGSTFSNDVTFEGDSTIHANDGKAGTLSGTVIATGTLTKAGAGTLTFSASSSLDVKTLNVSGGTLNISGATLSGATALNFNAASGNVNFKTDGADSATYDIGAISFNNSDRTGRNMTIDEGVTVNAASLSAAYAFGTVRVNGELNLKGAISITPGNTENANTITGSGSVSTTGVTIGNVLSVCTISVREISIGSGGITTNNSRTLTFGGDTTVKAVAAWTSSATLALLSGTAGTTFDTNGNDLALNGRISGAGKLVKTGAGTLTLRGANTYKGGTVIEAGTVVAGSETALGTTKGVEVKSGATLNLGTTAVTVFGLSGAGAVGLAAGTTSSTLTVDSATNSTFSGSIGSAVSLVKQGTGTLELSGANYLYSVPESAYQAVSVDGGTLRIVTNLQAMTHAGATTVARGAALEVSVSAGVSVSLTSVSISEGGKLIIDLSNYASATETFALDLITTSALQYNGEDFASDCTSFLGNAVELKGWTQTGWAESLAYDGSKLSLTMTIPEPSVFGLLAGLGALALAGTRRRRRKA